MSRAQSLFVTSLLVCSGVGTAVAQPLDARSVRPAVMLLVDTSGSMERLPDDGSASACEDCLPTCTGNSAQDSQQKNRWAVTVEALTGSFQNYTCQAVDRSTYPTTDYDYGYYLPHISFGTTPAQSTDGILDSFVSRVKFGLMTFDGVGTTIGGDTLVPYSTWLNSGSFRDQANGAPGMYSYGKIGRLSFPGCPSDYGVNAGARGPGNHPGALISVGLSDNADDVRTVNQRIQSSLLQVRPFGGTPIAAMLDDLEFYVKEDPAINASSDPFYQCRKRVGILITDGAPDALFRDTRFQCDPGSSGAAQTCAPVSNSTDTTAACSCPYDTAEVIARRLINPTDKLLEQLVVVAYNVHEPSALGTLNAIAENGWPSGRAPAGTNATYPYLITADGPNELRDRLDELLDGQQTGVTSRSVPVIINTGSGELGESNEESKRFDINAGFRMGRNTDEPWSGLLYRRRVTCNADQADGVTPYSVSEGDVFHESLNNQTTRNLFTVTPTLIGSTSGTLRNGSYAPEPAVFASDSNFDNGGLSLSSTHNMRHPYNGDFTLADSLIIDDSVTLSQAATSSAVNPRIAFDNSMPAGFFGDADNNGLPGQSADRTRIVNYVRGTSRTEKMADIYHSNPVALPPLTAGNLRTNELANVYSSWQRSLISTGAGAHYGSDGRPGVVFVGTNDGILHAFNLDTWSDRSGTTYPGGHELWGFIPPALFGKMASMVAPAHQLMFDGTPVVKDVVLQKKRNTPSIFRTVLVSALRGAPAFVALDVTFPESPTFMWQTTFPDVGETVGNPGLTQVTINWRGDNQQRAIAILPGGIGEQQASCAPTGHPLRNDITRSRFPAGNDRNVRCWKRRGRSLYVVDVATGELLQEFGAEHFPSPVTGSVVVDSIGLGNASAAYVFDHDGVLWRLSMQGTDPREWRVAPIYDMFANPVIRSVPLPQVTLKDWQAGRVPQYAPTLTRNTKGELVILAGTGDLDNTIDTAMQRVVSLTEHRSNEASGQIGGTVELNWQIDLAVNELVTGPLTLFENNVYFGTFLSQSGGNQCALGESRIYGAHAYRPLVATDIIRRPTPALKPTGALASSPVRVLSEVFDPTGSNLLLGLTIARSPICLGSQVTPNAVTGQLLAPRTGGDFTIVGNMAGGSSSGQTLGGSQIKQMPARPLQSTRPSSVSAWFGTVE